jgi:hypothetical protein
MTERKTDDEYWARIRAAVDAAPPFTDQQRERLAVLLRPAVAAVHRERLARGEAAR